MKIIGDSISLNDYIKEEILKGGGLPSDIKFLNTGMFSNIITELITTGQMERDAVLRVKPINDVLKEYGIVNYLKNMNVVFPSRHEEEREIHLIKCPIDSTENILKDISERGYVPTSSQYVAGMAMNENVIKKYRRIVSLDTKNIIFNSEYPGGIITCATYEDALIYLKAVTFPGRVWPPHWWFAVEKLN